MVDDELTPTGSGTLRNYLTYPHPRIEQFIEDIERHGEVHATFEHVDGEVECRLGTTKVVDAGIRVFDGDQWHTFAMDSLVTWDVPMDLYH